MKRAQSSKAFRFLALRASPDKNKETGFCVCKQPQFPISLFLPVSCLDNDADHAAIGVIHNLLHRILKFYLALVIHHRNLAADAVFHQLPDGFPENICLPDALFLVAGRLDIANQILRLFLTADDGRDFRLHVRADHMKNLCKRLQFYVGHETLVGFDSLYGIFIKV